MVARSVEPLLIPDVAWPVIHNRLSEKWVVRDAAHHSIIGQTGCGKSYLMRYGLFETCVWDKLLFIDGKGDDKTTVGMGHVVNRFPDRVRRTAKQLMRDNAPRDNWFRLVTSSKWDVARDQVGEALEQCMHEGDWVVAIDELRYVVDKREPGLNLGPQWEAIVLRGRSRGVGMVSATQEPRWVPGSFYTQSQFYWISRIEDERAMDRIAEIGASRELLPHLQALKKRRWIYTDNEDDDRFWGHTMVPARG